MMNLLKNNVLRSILYIVFFAGILKLSGMLLTWVWNNHLITLMDLPYITFLESVGILAFLYLVFSGVKFGFSTLTNSLNTSDKMTPGRMPQCRECEKIAHTPSLHNVNKLTPEEKEKLKEAIAKCCGFHHIPANGNAQRIQKIHPQKINS